MSKIWSVFGQDKTCMAAGVIGDGFGEKYLRAKKGLDGFQKKFDLPRVDYRGVQKWVCSKQAVFFVVWETLYHIRELMGMDLFKVDVGIEKIKTNKEILESSFNEAKTRVESALELLKRILAFSYLVVVFK